MPDAIDLVFHHDIQFRKQWEQIVRAYRVRTAYELLAPTGTRIPLANWSVLSGAELNLSNTIKRVFFVPDMRRGCASLRDFLHPDGEVAYCFGPDYGSIEPSLGAGDALVHIVLPEPTVPLYAAQAAHAALFDRWMKHK